MWIAHLACSHADCTEELELVVDRLDEVDAVACLCGHGWLLLSVSEVELV